MLSPSAREEATRFFEGAVTVGDDYGLTWHKPMKGLGWHDVRAYGAVGDGTTDDTVAIQAALTAACAVPGSVVMLPPGTHRTTGTLVLSAPVTLRGPGTITYVGDGHGLEVGPAGLEAVEHGRYALDGVTFEDCVTATAVVYLNPWAANVWIHGCGFFGNALLNCAEIQTSSNNWSVRIESNYLYNLRSVAGGHGIVSTDDVSTHLLVRGNTITGNSAGTGIRVAGGGSVIAGNKIEGYYTAIELGGAAGEAPQAAAHSIAVVDNYFEAGSDSQPLIAYHGYVGGASIRGNYANIHNSALPNAVFVGPTGANDRLANSAIVYNRVADCAQPLVTLNEDEGQTGLTATGNVDYTGTVLTISNHPEYFAA